MSGDRKTGAKTITRIVSANHLLEGEVVYRTEAGGWSPYLAQAAVVTGVEASQALLQGAETEPHLVVDVALADVTVDAGGVVTPVAHRERIRALGPSNRPDLGKQAGQDAATAARSSAEAA